MVGVVPCGTRFAANGPMWTNENRGHCDRNQLRYPSDVGNGR
jgi:hypothetical protein